MLLAQPLILRARIGDFAQFEREAVAVERGTPDFSLGKAAAEDGERVGLLAAIAGAGIGDIGGGGGAFEQEGALAIVPRADLQDGTREPKPGCGIIGRGGYDLAEQHHAVAIVVLLEGGVEFAPQLRDRLAHLPGLRLDLAFEPDRCFLEIVALEGFFGGDGRQGHKHGERGNDAGADERKHWKTSHGQQVTHRL